MPSYLHPGVYIEEIPSGVKPIEGVSTSTAAFVGYTTQGPVGVPVLLFKFDDYARRFGGLRDLGGGTQGDAMGFSVAAFFQNGGTKAYIVRLAQGSNDHPLTAAVGYLGTPDPTDALEVSALNPGAWGNGLIVRVTSKASDPSLFTVEVGRANDRGDLQVAESFSDVSFDSASSRFIEGVINGVSETVTTRIRPLSEITGSGENFRGTLTSGDLSGVSLDLSADADTARTLTLSLDGGASTATVVLPADDFANLAAVAAAIQTQVRGGGATAVRRVEFTAEAQGNRLVLTSGSRLEESAVTASGALATTLKLTGPGSVAKTGAESLADSDQVELTGGADGEEVDLQAYADTFTVFEKIRDISILCLPGKAWDATGQAVIQSAIAHAEKIRNRMVIVDPPNGTELITEKNVTDLGLPTSTYSVLYYPWVRVANPFYDTEDNPGAPVTVEVPPSGYAAGMWSKIDGRRGVWKAPAGVETALLGLAGTEFTVEDAEQDQLNPLGVNALRRLPGFGHVVWGSRTLSTRSNPEWRYVPVRRTAIFIEQSLYNGIQWAVFEPNDHRLWASLRLNMESFMDGLFRAGAFQGRKASDAYFVRCGLGDTMTQDDIDRGQVIAIVAFAPLKPAEFVIVRIQQKVAQQ